MPHGPVGPEFGVFVLDSVNGIEPPGSLQLFLENVIAAQNLGEPPQWHSSAGVGREDQVPYRRAICEADVRPAPP